MDEYNSGMDPELKRYFLKIVRSISWGAFWLLTIATMGIYFQLGYVSDGIKWYNLLFYFILLSSLFLLLRYFYRNWK